MSFEIGENASIKKVSFADQDVAFRQDDFKSCLYIVLGKETFTADWKPLGPNRFEASFGSIAMPGGDIHATLEYKMENDIFTASVTVKNDHTSSSFKPSTMGFKTGLNCYQDKYPDWNDIHFPTMLRCEKTHFWGYCQSPSGRLLTVTCAEPVATWSMDYNLVNRNLNYMKGGHRIYTFNLHLLNRLPKPGRHPLLDELLPGEEKTWNIQFSVLPEMDRVYERCSRLTGAPVVAFDRYTLDGGEKAKATVYGNPDRITMVSESGKTWTLQNQNGRVETVPLEEIGVYKVLAEGNGHISESLIYRKHENSWYLNKARDNILEMPPIYTHHLEAFTSLFTMLIARRVLPDTEKDTICEKYFVDIFNQLYNKETNMVNEFPKRIQDSAGLSDLMARRYLVTEDPQDLRYAGHLADFILDKQGEDGAYYTYHNGVPVHYTCVAYLAKYIHETAMIEEIASQKYPEFAEPARRHMESSWRAVRNLCKLRDNIETEGEITFEDGMIACSLHQLAEAAMFTQDAEEKKQYIEAAEYMYTHHRSLTQLLIPDCRMNGGTLRFWETQYNVHIFHRAMSSPCGWTAWKLYGVFDLYLLTGKLQYLHDFINGMGSCLQLIDGNTGSLRWAFLCDPYIETLRYVQQEEGVLRGKLIDDIITEEYVDMVSRWHRVEKFPRQKWCIDHLVFEIFKCLGDTILQTAFVYENEEGKLEGYNCTFAEKEGAVVVTPREGIISAVHCNFRENRSVSVRFLGETQQSELRFGWIKRHDIA